MIGIRDIERVIPHRHPILLVDRVDEIVPGRTVTARKAVTAAESCFADAVTDVYPLGLTLESWAQAAVLLACWEQPNPDVVTGMVELATGIRGVQVDAEVRPGDVLVHRAEIVRALDGATILRGASTVDGRPVLSVEEFSVALRDLVVLTGAGSAR